MALELKCVFLGVPFIFMCMISTVEICEMGIPNGCVDVLIFNSNGRCSGRSVGGDGNGGSWVLSGVGYVMIGKILVACRRVCFIDLDLVGI